MANSTDEDIRSLSTLFDDGLQHFNNLDKSEEPTNNPLVQLNIKTTIRTFEQATRLVSLSGIFSRNEGIEEVATGDLRYFLLPALLGCLSLKLTTGERKDIVNAAEIYFKDFLSRCNDYGLSNYEFKRDQTETDDGDDVMTVQRIQTEFEQLATSVNTRANKIQRFREQKELKSKLSDLKANMDNQNVDDEIKRNYYLTMIKLFIHQAIDEINSIEMEKPILEHMARLKKDDGNIQKQSKRPPPPPLKPIIITKDEVQKAVYGAGYPSLPTMTVQEFYDKRVQDGVFPDPNKKPTGPLSLQQTALAGVEVNNDDLEDKAREECVDADDEQYLENMRHMDEYKDEHRRGWGNRMNRS